MNSTVGLYFSFVHNCEYRQNFRYRTLQPAVKGKVEEYTRAGRKV